MALAHSALRTTAVMLLLGAVSVIQPTLTFAQESSPVQVTDSGISLDFQGTDLPVVVSMLAELAGLTVSYSDLPSRPVTLRSATPIPRSQIKSMLESVLQSNGLSMTLDGALVRIERSDPPPASTAGAVAASAESSRAGPGVRLFTYRLLHTEAETLAATLRELFGLSPRALRDGAKGAGPQSLTEQLNDQPLPAPTEAMGAPVGGIGAQVHGPVQILPFSPTNSIIVRASAEDYGTIEAAIKELDTRPLQVVIEALIAEVQIDDQNSLGVGISLPDSKDLHTGATIGGELTGSSEGDVVLHVLGLGKASADVVIHALAASSDVKVLSRPVILAENNQEARIMVGEQRPFIQVSRSLPTDDAVRDQVVQYRDVGTELTITPTINPDGNVTLKVLQEVSNATAETQFGAPVISTREAETQLFVQDGHTAVIGGLIGHQQQVSASGIPILRDIPLLGQLFRSTQRRRTSTELFILLTPHVIRADEDMDSVTDKLRNTAKKLRGQWKPPLINPDAPAVKTEDHR